MGIIFNLNQNDHVSSRVTPVVSIEICNNTRSDNLLLKEGLPRCFSQVMMAKFLLVRGKCHQTEASVLDGCLPLLLYEEACASPSSRRESLSQTGVEAIILGVSQTGVKADFSPCSVEKPMNSDCSQIRPVIRD